MIVSARNLRRSLVAGLALMAMLAAPAHGQFRGLLPRDVRNVTDDARDTNAGCEDGEKQSVGRRVLGGILGRTARNAARKSGVTRWVRTDGVSDQLTTEIACRLDPEEQKLAAEATLNATRGNVIAPEAGGEGGGDDGLPTEDPIPQVAVGSTASWKSGTRDEVSGTSTVVSRDASADNLDCITVTDVVIVKGEETTANKRMCRPVGSRRYSLIA